MRILLLSSLTLAFFTGTADAQTFRTAQADGTEAEERRDTTAPAAEPARLARQRHHAHQAQQMARAYHTRHDGDAGPSRRHAPLNLDEAVIVDRAAQPDED
ncbi:hypothetical protein [Maricaulis sp.]|uniref:hypothetical protein n=1 Tax=Maricaulis sp. TaxID=1486257 RepID=UPI00263814C3|nr:hypothetical protein [Maricaulis sp.]